MFTKTEITTEKLVLHNILFTWKEITTKQSEFLDILLMWNKITSNRRWSRTFCSHKLKSQVNSWCPEHLVTVFIITYKMCICSSMTDALWYYKCPMDCSLVCPPHIAQYLHNGFFKLSDNDIPLFIFYCGII